MADGDIMRLFDRRKIEELPKTRGESRILGIRHFFTGEPCKYGHIEPRFTSTPTCMGCGRIYALRNYEKNKEYLAEKRRETTQKWREKNRERHRESVKRWRQLNPDKKKAQHQNRRSQKKNADGVHNSGDIYRIRKAKKDRCAYCRVKLGVTWHIDHIQPLSKGGTNWPRNLQILCAVCNTSKYARDPIECCRSRGYLL